MESSMVAERNVFSLKSSVNSLDLIQGTSPELLTGYEPDDHLWKPSWPPCPKRVATEMKPPAALRINRKIPLLIFTRYGLA